jgi:hypothetical protein
MVYPESSDRFAAGEPTDALRSQLRQRQQFVVAALAGIVAGVVGGFIWGAITGISGLHVEFVCLPMVGIGLLVGKAMAFFGRGVDLRFAWLGAIIATLACLAGYTTLGALLPHPSFDLLRRPLLRQSGTDGFVDLGIFHLALQGTLLPPPLGLPLGLGGKVLAVRAVAPQLAADRRRTTLHGPCDFLLIGSLMPQLCYTITLFQCKMMCHRWDSIPKEKFARLSPIGCPSDVSSYTSFRGSFFKPRLHLRFETAIRCLLTHKVQFWPGG